MKEWEKLEPGFESGKMAKYLQKHEPVFKELKTKMSAFFENIRDAQKRQINMCINKAIHPLYHTKIFLVGSPRR